MLVGLPARGVDDSPYLRYSFAFRFGGRRMAKTPDIRKTFEFRCPVHGFIEVSDWERQVIAQPAFQRLRRIRQLAWTEYVYPGATHTRFEHSLGVMHVATKLYDGVTQRSREMLVDRFFYN